VIHPSLQGAGNSELKEICIEISKRYEIHFIEIGTAGDHAHFLVQSVPTYSPTKIVRTIKSITARELFRRLPSVKEALWGGEFWTDGYFINTVGKKNNETVIQKYIQSQGKEAEYSQLHYEQLQLF
jgi:REP element-mobilizing transposase RayT